jgi:hypothetical protein
MNTFNNMTEQQAKELLKLTIHREHEKTQEIKRLGQENERYSKRWTLEQLSARKERCVEKCEHEPELIIDYEDGSLHCLHCVADEFWKYETPQELKRFNVSVDGQVHFPVYDATSTDKLIASLNVRLKAYEEREASIACAELEQSANDHLAKQICDENARLHQQPKDKEADENKSEYIRNTDRFIAERDSLRRELSEAKAEIERLTNSIDRLTD